MKIGIVLVIVGVVLAGWVTPSDRKLKESIARGKEIYSENCITCHMAKGEGVVGAFPPLAASDYFADSTELAIRAIKFGLRGAIKVNGKVYDSMMPEPGLSNAEVADVTNYILNSWGNKPKKGRVTEQWVEGVK